MQIQFDLIWYKAISTLRADSAKSYLSYLWWILDPVIYMGVFYIVFGLIFQRGGEDFVVYLLTGLVIWRWFEGSVKQGAYSITNNANLMRQVYVSKVVFPLVVILTYVIKFTIVFGMLLLFLLVYGIEPTLLWLYLPVLLLALLSLITGLTLVGAALIPFIPDIKVFVDYGMTLLFFLSGIFFDISHVPENLKAFFAVNPIALVINAFREILLNQQQPDWIGLACVAGAGAILAVIGYLILKAKDLDYPKVTML